MTRVLRPLQARAQAAQGQVALITAVFLVVLLAAAAFTIDVGKWYREDRALQARVDAATLAGAQGIKDGTATALALEYADKNGGGITAADISFETTVVPDDTIVVSAEQQVEGSFSRVLGIASVDVHALAKAQSGVPSAARYVAPITVNVNHPMLQCLCFGEGYPTEIGLADLHNPGSADAAGAFALIELDGGGGTAGESTMASWMASGYDAYMPLGTYNSVPSAMFNGNAMQEAFNLRIGDVVLFPVYETVTYGGSTAEFEVVAWVGFHITGSTGGGPNTQIQGYFVSVTWDGVPTDDPSSVPDLGVTSIRLLE